MMEDEEIQQNCMQTLSEPLRQEGSDCQVRHQDEHMKEDMLETPFLNLGFI